jgi:hypothetical protein
MQRLTAPTMRSGARSVAPNQLARRPPDGASWQARARSCTWTVRALVCPRGHGAESSAPLGAARELWRHYGHAARSSVASLAKSSDLWHWWARRAINGAYGQSAHLMGPVGSTRARLRQWARRRRALCVAPGRDARDGASMCSPRARWRRSASRAILGGKGAVARSLAPIDTARAVRARVGDNG